MNPQEFYAYKGSMQKKIESMQVFTTTVVDIYVKVSEDSYQVDKTIEVTRIPAGYLYNGTFVPGGNPGARI